MAKPSDRYWTLSHVARERILPLLETGLRPGLLNSVFGLPTDASARSGLAPSANQKYWVGWFWEFTEIDAAVRRLDQSLVYLSHYPSPRHFRLHGLSEADWIRYHLEAYFQETYILSKRFSRFLRKIEKVTHAAGDSDGSGWVKKLRSVSDSAFKSLVAVRSGHVHEYRFQDGQLRDLDTLVLLTKAGALRNLRGLRRIRFHQALMKWRKELRNNNRQIDKFCVVLFEETTKILIRNEPPRPTAAPS